MQNNIEHIFKLLSNYEYISFDLFDTLIFRSVSKPTDIFKMIPIIYNSNHHTQIDPYRFFIDRIVSEKKARKKAVSEDILLDDIYDNLPSYYTQKEYLKQLEIDIEINNCIPNHTLLKVLDFCVAKGKTVIITTDMYLPRSCIEAILQKSRITCAKIYISSEIGLTKLSGNLFKHILSDLCISPRQLIHIGDNAISDIQMAQNNGISSLLTPLEHACEHYSCNRLSLNIGLNHLVNLSKHYCNYEKREEYLGEFIVAPLIIEFCHWIHFQKQKLKIHDLFFVAREGYYIKKVYELLYPEDRNHSHYICLNKNLLRLPFLSIQNDITSIISTFPDWNHFSWNMIISLLSSEDYIDDISASLNERNIDFSPNHVITKKDIINHRYDDIIYTILNIISTHIAEQKKLLLNYLSDNGLLTDSKKALINNSINGNAQYQLEVICNDSNINCNVIGLQFLKSTKCDKILHNKVFAWLENDYLPQNLINEFKRDCILFEHFLFEDIGTAKKLAPGDCSPIVCFEQNYEGQWNSSILESLQLGASKLLQKYKKHMYIPIGQDILSLYLSFKTNPYYSDCELVKKMIDYDYDGKKSIIDEQIEFKYIFLLGGKKMPLDIRWPHGYLSIKKKKKFIPVYDFLNLLRDNKLSRKAWFDFLFYKYIEPKYIGIKEKAQITYLEKRFTNAK